MSDLPPGWAKTTLGEVATPGRPKINPTAAPSLPFIGLENVEAHTMRLLGTVPASAVKSAAVQFQAGDVLYGRLRPYLNKVVRADFQGLCSAEFIAFPPSSVIDPAFLQYILNSREFVSYASRLNAGDRPRVDFDQISPFPILLPPLSEQRRIVAGIEKQFTRLISGTSGLAQTAKKLKSFDMSSLQTITHCHPPFAVDRLPALPDGWKWGLLGTSSHTYKPESVFGAKRDPPQKPR